MKTRGEQTGGSLGQNTVAGWDREGSVKVLCGQFRQWPSEQGTP